MGLVDDVPSLLDIKFAASNASLNMASTLLINSPIFTDKLSTFVSSFTMWSVILVGSIEATNGEAECGGSAQVKCCDGSLHNIGCQTKIRAILTNLPQR